MTFFIECKRGLRLFFIEKKGAVTFFSSKKRGGDFFSSNKKGAATFFHRKKRGRGLFFKRKKWGAEFFTRGKIPQTRPRYPVNFERSLTFEGHLFEKKNNPPRLFDSREYYDQGDIILAKSSQSPKYGNASP